MFINTVVYPLDKDGKYDTTTPSNLNLDTRYIVFVVENYSAEFVKVVCDSATPFLMYKDDYQNVLKPALRKT